MHLHVADFRADGASLNWNLGTIKIYYKEGQDEGSTNGIKSDFQPLETITFTLPPPEKQIGLAVSFPFSL